MIPDVVLYTSGHQEEVKKQVGENVRGREKEQAGRKRKISLLRLKERLMRRREQNRNRERKYNMSTMWRETTISASL